MGREGWVDSVPGIDADEADRGVTGAITAFGSVELALAVAFAVAVVAAAYAIVLSSA